jgi:hypothetical protein
MVFLGLCRAVLPDCVVLWIGFVIPLGLCPGLLKHPLMMLINPHMPLLNVIMRNIQ